MECGTYISFPNHLLAFKHDTVVQTHQDFRCGKVHTYTYMKTCACLTYMMTDRNVAACTGYTKLYGPHLVADIVKAITSFGGSEAALASSLQLPVPSTTSNSSDLDDFYVVEDSDFSWWTGVTMRAPVTMRDVLQRLGIISCMYQVDKLIIYRSSCRLQCTRIGFL